MNSIEQKFVELAEKHEALTEQLKAVSEELNAAMTALGYDTIFQGFNGIVYKIVKPKGGFVYYKDVDYKRTRLEGEKGGDYLSKKEAQEAGFSVE